MYAGSRARVVVARMPSRQSDAESGQWRSGGRSEHGSELTAVGALAARLVARLRLGLLRSMTNYSL